MRAELPLLQQSSLLLRLVAVAMRTVVVLQRLLPLLPLRAPLQELLLLLLLLLGMPVDALPRVRVRVGAVPRLLLLLLVPPLHRGRLLHRLQAFGSSPTLRFDMSDSWAAVGTSFCST